MALLVWFTMGIALWHFTVFLPDHFWQGIVGAFLGAVLGAIVFGAIVEVDQRPRPRQHRPRHGADRRSPGWRSAWASSTLIGLRAEQAARVAAVSAALSELRARRIRLGRLLAWAGAGIPQGLRG